MKKIDLMLDGVFLNNIYLEHGKLGINIYTYNSDIFLGHISFKNHKLRYYKENDFYELVRK